MRAAELCGNYSRGDQTDWFLPFEGELNQLYLILHLANLGSFSDGNYWSSTEFGYCSAWFQVFSPGLQGGNLRKSSTLFVSPMRSFEF